MSTPNLQLTEVTTADTPAAASLNDSFRSLDSTVQLSVLSRTTATPPALAVQGDRYIVPADSSGEWVGRTNHIAYRTADGWRYRVPRPGWRAWSVTDGALLVFTGSAWRILTASQSQVRATWVRAGAAIELPVNFVPHYFFAPATVRGIAILTIGGPGNCEVDVLKGNVSASPGYPDSVSICGGSPPEIAAGESLIDTTLAGWDTSIEAGDFIVLDLAATATFTAIFAQLLLEDA
jgi:hypothetical protein